MRSAARPATSSSSESQSARRGYTTCGGPRLAGWRRPGLVAVALVSALGCDMLRVNVSGVAMAPTLNDGDRVLATRDVTILELGDIVGFRSPQDESKSFVERIVGLPGDRIEMRQGVVMLNGTLLDEPYVAPENRSTESWGPVTVPADEYFVMGDNRRNSSDSRVWGTVRREAIWAKVIVGQTGLPD